jgi:flagellar biosynthesis protein FlhB
MAEDTGGEKSLPATPKKREQARQRGNIAKSQDLSAAITLGVALIAMMLLGPRMLHLLVGAFRYYLGGLSTIPVTESTIQAVTLGMIYFVGSVVLPLMLLIAIAGAAINLVQVGFLFTMETITPKFEKLNVFAGFGKFFSPRSLAELVKSLLKLVAVGYVVYLTLRSRWEGLLQISYLSPYMIVGAVGSLVVAVWLRVVLVMLILGILDYAFQKWMHDRELMMTVHEAREEAKQLEGNPQIKRRIREVQRQMAYQRMMRDVPTADVVITNPTTYAVALRYDANAMEAPKVVAKGMRLVAGTIRDLAVEHDVPIVQKPELARSLFRGVEVGDVIPEALFRAVAEILSYVYEIDQREEKRRERQTMMAPVRQAAI